MKGRYTTIVADMSRFSYPDYQISLCSVGIMGNKYERPADGAHVVTSRTVKTNEAAFDLAFPDIAPVHAMGNTILVKMRIAGTKPAWVEDPVEAATGVNAIKIQPS